MEETAVPRRALRGLRRSAAKESAAQTAEESATRPSEENAAETSVSVSPAQKPPEKPDAQSHQRKIPLVTALLCIALAIFLTFQITFLALRANYQSALKSLQLESTELLKFKELDELLSTYYDGELDKSAMLEAMLEAYVDADGDRYGEYYTAEEYAALQSSQNGDAVGIGVIISSEEEGLRILWVTEGSPAQSAGLLKGDLLVAVDGKDYASLGAEGMTNAIRGESGSRVSLTLQRNSGETSSDGEPLFETVELSLTRAAYTSTSVMYEMLSDGESGKITLLQFDKTTSEQFRSAVETLQSMGAKRLIFDLRGNGGGLLSSVIDVLDQILPKGSTIVTVTNAAGESKVYTSESDGAIELPMAVLCNHSTASAAELFTAALRDYDKAVIVGETTYGKGVAQTTYRLSDGSAVKMTTSRYDPPCGVNYDGIGITPDVVVSLPDGLTKGSVYAIPEDSDPQLLAALSSLKS